MKFLGAFMLLVPNCLLALKINQQPEVSITAVKSVHPYYHTGSEITDQLKQLAQTCPHLSLREESHGEIKMDVVTLKKNRDPNHKPVNKNFMLFGEHARELISPESGLHFVKTLCGHSDIDTEFTNSLSDKLEKLFEDNEFDIVLNANPRSRLKVEQGESCLRVNENGVDINRNYPVDWGHFDEGEQADTNPGPHALSEPEVKLLVRLMTKYQPTHFLTIHSGTKGMYMPYAKDPMRTADRNGPEMMKILFEVDKDYCECPFGGAGKEVGYQCPGTCLDWAYDVLKVPYTFAFEIYGDPAYDSFLKQTFTEHAAKMQLQANATTQAHKDFNFARKKHPSDSIQLMSQAGMHHLNLQGKSNEECFAIFNPGSPATYKSTVENWSKVYIDLVEKVAENLKKGKASF